MPVKEQVFLKLTCPYCEMSYSKMFYDNGKMVVRCDYDSVGCDKDYVIDVRVNITMLTYKLEVARLNAPSVLNPGDGFGTN